MRSKTKGCPLVGLFFAWAAFCLVGPTRGETLSFGGLQLTTDDAVIAQIDEVGPCVQWSEGVVRVGNEITISGIRPPVFCIAPGLRQRIQLGRLPVGEYQVKLALQGIVTTTASVEIHPPAESEVVADVFPPLPTTADMLRVHLAGGFLPTCNIFVPTTLTSDEIQLHTTFLPIDPCGQLPLDQWLDVGFVPEGSYRLTLNGEVLGAVTVHAPTTRVDLAAFGRYRAEVTLRHGEPRPAGAIRLTMESGYFWFASPDNPEVVVKVLNGTAINGHVWVFASSLTNQPFTLTVTDRFASCGGSPCPPRVYVVPAGRGRSIVDLRAF